MVILESVTNVNSHQDKSITELKIYKNCRDFLKICYTIAWSKRVATSLALLLGLPTPNGENDNKQYDYDQKTHTLSFLLS